MQMILLDADSDNKNMRVSLDYSQASMLSNALDDVSKETPIIEYNKAQLELANAFDGVRVAAKKSSDGVPSELIADAQNGRLYIEKLINFIEGLTGTRYHAAYLLIGRLRYDISLFWIDSIIY